jgi:hypothetical protein
MRLHQPCRVPHPCAFFAQGWDSTRVAHAGWQTSRFRDVGDDSSIQSRPAAAPLVLLPRAPWAGGVSSEIGSALPRRDRPAPTKNGFTLLRRRCAARHRSYWVCMPIHSSGLVPRASASFSAMTAEISALPFKMRDRATRVTPRCLAVSVTDLAPRYSRRTLPGCGGLCMRIRPLSDSPDSPLTRHLPLQR